MANQEKRVQIGVCAMRDEHGNFLPAKPIYARAEDAEAAAAERRRCFGTSPSCWPSA